MKILLEAPRSITSAPTGMPMYHPLPLEILDHILQYALSSIETENHGRLLIVIAKVCRAWRLCAVRRIYRSIDVTKLLVKNRRRALALCQTLRLYPSLAIYIKKLTLLAGPDNGPSRINYQLMRFCSETPKVIVKGDTPKSPLNFLDTLGGMKLRSLRLDTSSNLFRSDLSFIRFLQTLPQIEEVELSCLSFSTYSSRSECRILGPISLARTAHTFLPLVQLDMHDGGIFSYNGLQQLSQLHVPHIKYLSLRYDGGSDSDGLFIRILNNLSAHVVRLKLSRTDTDELSLDNRMEVIAALNSCTSLTRLGICTALLKLEDIPKISRPIETFERLDRFELRECVRAIRKILEETTRGSEPLYKVFPSLYYWCQNAL